MNKDEMESTSTIDVGSLEPRRKPGRPKKLTAAQEEEAHQLFQAGYSAASIAKAFQINKVTLWQLCRQRAAT